MDKEKTLFGVVAAEALLVFGFLISSFTVANTANAGFNVVFTGLLNCVYCAGCLYVLRKSKTPLSYGFLIGSSATMALLSLMTAIYWGQLSNCESTSANISQYTCENKDGMRAVCAFASLLFIIQLLFTVALIFWRDAILNDSTSYSDISNVGTGESMSNPTASSPYSSSYGYAGGASGSGGKQVNTSNTSSGYSQSGMSADL